MAVYVMSVAVALILRCHPIPAHGGAMDDDSWIIVYYDATVRGVVVRRVRDEDIANVHAEYDIIAQVSSQSMRAMIDYVLVRLYGEEDER